MPNKHKHQWDYLGIKMIGNQPIMADRTETAIWVCPYCLLIVAIPVKIIIGAEMKYAK